MESYEVPGPQPSLPPPEEGRQPLDGFKAAFAYLMDEQAVEYHQYQESSRPIVPASPVSNGGYYPLQTWNDKVRQEGTGHMTPAQQMYELSLPPTTVAERYNYNSNGTNHLKMDGGEVESESSSNHSVHLNHDHVNTKVTAGSNDKNNPKYKERRERNNVAVRKSREKAKIVYREMEKTVQRVCEENELLRARVDVLTEELNYFRSLFCKCKMPEDQRIGISEFLDGFQRRALEHSLIGQRNNIKTRGYGRTRAC